MDHVDVLVVGAGLSGIGAAVHLRTRLPQKSFTILEARDAIGGTWDLFRYPGIRSDSDMHTLGYSFKPWNAEKAIADGPAILDYVRETAREHDVERHIRFGHKVVSAEWSTKDARWVVSATTKSGETVRVSCHFLFVCSGYYDYAGGYTPDFPGIERYRGKVVHPQKWTDDVDYAGKRVVVIGSGATAVTLVPAMAEKAAHVTMLQRSPTYIVSRPAVDAIASKLRRALPAKVAYGATRWKNVAMGMAFFQFCRKFPEKAKSMLVGQVRKSIGKKVDVGEHFSPSYHPWDQRVCLVPDGDLFVALESGKAEVVTDHIETFTETGITLRSGKTLEADLVVTATGLRLQFIGGMKLVVDGKTFDPGSLLNYKGALFRDVPNMAVTFGYTNASWTLKCDLTCEYVCRLLAHMEKKGLRICVPRLRDGSVKEEPLLDFSSGYVTRAANDLPKQGSKVPWRVHQNYALDILGLRHGPLEDESLELT